MYNRDTRTRVSSGSMRTLGEKSKRIIVTRGLVIRRQILGEALWMWFESASIQGEAGWPRYQELKTNTICEQEVITRPRYNPQDQTQCVRKPMWAKFISISERPSRNQHPWFVNYYCGAELPQYKKRCRDFPLTEYDKQGVMYKVDNGQLCQGHVEQSFETVK